MKRAAHPTQFFLKYPSPGLQREQLPDFKAFFYVRTAKFFPPTESWLVDSLPGLRQPYAKRSIALSFSTIPIACLPKLRKLFWFWFWFVAYVSVPLRTLTSMMLNVPLSFFIVILLNWMFHWPAKIKIVWGINWRIIPTITFIPRTFLNKRTSSARTNGRPWMIYPVMTAS